jgi:N utilization substance protein A
MEQEIAEIGEGLVEIKHVSRQPGSRSKVAVYSKDPNIDPSGACIGTHGLRIARVLSQINGEKIDVVNYSENPALVTDPRGLNHATTQ